ncbi:MAG: hypothetical protein DME76_06515 [Verrucomicrobia bacterium]|nr:MAG: hypothetical protein DME76_06515 [Verrucomicrobiota bacterium]
MRRLITTRRRRRTFSEVELIFKESTNVAAAFVIVWGTSGSSRSAKLFPFSRVGIVLSYSTSLLLAAV